MIVFGSLFHVSASLCLGSGILNVRSPGLLENRINTRSEPLSSIYRVRTNGVADPDLIGGRSKERTNGCDSPDSRWDGAPKRPSQRPGYFRPKHQHTHSPVSLVSLIFPICQRSTLPYAGNPTGRLPCFIYLCRTVLDRIKVAGAHANKVIVLRSASRVVGVVPPLSNADQAGKRNFASYGRVSHKHTHLICKESVATL